jgi:hypothetical protein
MPVHLFAGLRVRDFQAARPWHGVRKVLYHDPDGNEVGFGGPPV